MKLPEPPPLPPLPPLPPRKLVRRLLRPSSPSSEPSATASTSLDAATWASSLDAAGCRSKKPLGGATRLSYTRDSAADSWFSSGFCCGGCSHTFTAVSQPCMLALPQPPPVYTLTRHTTLTYHLYEPGSIPGGLAAGFPHAEILLDDADGRRVFSGISRSPPPPRPCNLALLHTHLASPSSDLKTPILRATQNISTPLYTDHMATQERKSDQSSVESRHHAGPVMSFPAFVHCAARQPTHEHTPTNNTRACTRTNKQNITKQRNTRREEWAVLMRTPATPAAVRESEACLPYLSIVWNVESRVAAVGGGGGGRGVTPPHKRQRPIVVSLYGTGRALCVGRQVVLPSCLVNEVSHASCNLHHSVQFIVGLRQRSDKISAALYPAKSLRKLACSVAHHYWLSTRVTLHVRTVCRESCAHAGKASLDCVSAIHERRTFCPSDFATPRSVVQVLKYFLVRSHCVP
ncbi:hypothetical protein PR048_024408 [Dryococelus australis]|uniref:Uncharacterized protein n=1 Tax=Dryococelus australis TaxID=614101 RepID=A0ABQ9GNJ3_9NEOP|nr:hypothetical protein PR048_024408 [Dryococelus australis]